MNRTDALIAKHPEHAEAIHLLAERDPAGNGKYLQWQVRVLVAGRALAPEIADVTALFHKHAPRSVRFHHRRRDGVADIRLRPDLYSYEPGEFTRLRDLLLRLQKEQDKKRRRVERLYRIDGTIDAPVVYESERLVVRHIKNKNASVHHGLGTKWCIAMKQADYWDHYDSSNTVFFFLARKKPQRDRFDRIAIGYGRDDRNVPTECTYTDALDEPTSDMALRREFGSDFHDLTALLYSAACYAEPSLLARLRAGTLDAAGAEIVWATVAARAGARQLDLHQSLLALAASPATPAHVLAEMAARAPALLDKETGRRVRRRYSHWRNKEILAALFAHPATPPAVADGLRLRLRRGNVDTDTITVRPDRGEICVEWRSFRAPRGYYRRGRKVRFLGPHWRHRHLTVAMARAAVRRAETRLRMAKKRLARTKKRETASKKKRTRARRR